MGYNLELVRFLSMTESQSHLEEEIPAEEMPPSDQSSGKLWNNLLVND